MKHTLLFLLTSFFLYSTTTFAQLKVVATSTDVAAILKEVGKNEISLETLAKGSQNLHSLEAKPSFMVKLNKADLLVSNGLGLEEAWLSSVLRGARNPKLTSHSKGHLELGSLLHPLEVPTQTLTRAEGDLHSQGNPHWTLDPLRVADAAEIIAQRLGELDVARASLYSTRAAAFKKRLAEQTAGWQKRLQATGIQKIVVYHKTLNYFLNRFNIHPAAYLEPKPGIPPSTSHLLKMIAQINNDNIPLILVEHYYDPKIAERLKKEAPKIQIRTVPVSVDSLPGTSTPEELFEKIVQTFEGHK